ncbi:MAG: DUF2971 domain-containing protein [Halobacteriovorax sp.]|nr:DUF2971 domain-containing protein [Halobacteriovorax sp.]|tara:strand:+ start:26034 stop:27470 length:1437 start_codon:yes stop_codon:yes gene_type:complete
MSEYIYRFRSIEKIIEFQELEKQEIYFSDPKDLNDPLEGFRDIYWQGDQTLWKNLFKNYLLCLQDLYLMIRIGGEDHLVTDESIHVFSTFDRLPTPIYQDKIKSIFDDFFSNEKIITLIEGISQRDSIRRTELIFYLESIHLYCLQLIKNHDDTVESKGEFDTEMDNLLGKNPLFNMDFFNLLKKAKEEHNKLENLEDVIFEVIQHTASQTKLISSLNNLEKMENNKKFYLFDFPSKYVKQLEKLMFWPWYTACFSKNPKDPSMWGYYANGHKGICLKFKSTEKNKIKGINLNTVTGYGGNKNETRKHYGERFFELHDINYNSKVKPIGFFRSIGRLPYPDLINQWYSNENKELSPLVQDIIQGQDSWREAYWKRFYNDIPLKMKEWSHEEETRLVHTSILNDTVEEKDRLLKYNFNDLDGIIFGLNTSDEDKIRIINIVHDKCMEYDSLDFNFYQANYDVKTSQITISPLSLIKFTK